jgi:hypothetical protein
VGLEKNMFLAPVPTSSLLKQASYFIRLCLKGIEFLGRLGFGGELGNLCEYLPVLLHIDALLLS